MLRNLVTICVLTVASLLLYAQGAGSSAQNPLTPAPPAAARQQQLPANSVVEVAPDAPVVTIEGICSAGKSAADKPGSCKTIITRKQFESMLASMNITNQSFSPAAMHSIAESYVQMVALADAGEKAGIDKEPQFEELMKVVRVRALAEAYRRSLAEKYGNPSQEEITAYYNQNINKFEQLKVDRIFIPLANPKRPQENRAEFEKKARQLAGGIRERAAKGEDPNSLQSEAYKVLGLASPPSTDLGSKRKGNFPPPVENDIFALKPGEVTKVEVDLAGFSIYKVRSREAIPVEYVKTEITRELSQKSMEKAIKAVTGQVHSELNEDFFRPHPTGPVAPSFRPAPHVIVQPGPAAAPAGAASAPGAPPAVNNPAPQTPGAPK